MIGIPPSIISLIGNVDLFDILTNLSMISFTPERPQICLTMRKNSTDPLYEGAGRAKYPEEEFTEISTPFVGTPFGDVVEKLPIRCGRVRLLCLYPKQAYSLHRDTEERLHIAIQTNKQATMLVDAHNHKLWKIHIPLDGNIYRVDTRLLHTAFNGGDEPRIHLVANILP